MARKRVASVFQDLYPADQAAAMEIRAQLLRGLTDWLKASGLTQMQAAKTLGVTQARVSDLNRARSTDSAWTCSYGSRRELACGPNSGWLRRGCQHLGTCPRIACWSFPIPDVRHCPVRVTTCNSKCDGLNGRSRESFSSLSATSRRSARASHLFVRGRSTTARGSLKVGRHRVKIGRGRRPRDGRAPRPMRRLRATRPGCCGHLPASRRVH